MSCAARLDADPLADVDLSEQLAAVWARRVLVVAVAVVVAFGVLLWRASAPERYESTTTVQVRLPAGESGDPSLTVAYYAETVAGLATNREVVATALDDLDDAARTELPTDVEDVVEGLATEAGENPGFVTITASATSAAAAAELADAVGVAVIDRVSADQADDLAAERSALSDAVAEVGRERVALPQDDFAGRAALIRERESLLSALRSSSGRAAWQAVTVEPAQEASAPVAPTPARDALLAFLVALILVAEGVVLRRAWRGSLASRDPAGDAGEVLGVPGVTIAPESGPGALAALLPLVDDAARVIVVHRGRQPQAHTAALLAELLAGRGRDVLLLDSTPQRAAVHDEVGTELVPGFADLPTDSAALARDLQRLPRAGRLRVLGAGSPDGLGSHEPDRQLARVLAAAPDDVVVVAASVGRLDELVSIGGGTEVAGAPVVLDVDAAGATRRGLRQEGAALRGLGASVVAVTSMTGTQSVSVRREARRGRGGAPRVGAGRA